MSIKKEKQLVYEFVANIEAETLRNRAFRRVLHTGEYAQLVVMSLKPGEEIGMETHPTVDQFFRVEAGEGEVTVNGVDYDVKDGDCFIIPAGSEHNVKNESEDEPLLMYTIYSPPNHAPGVVHETKEQAMMSE